MRNRLKRWNVDLELLRAMYAEGDVSTGGAAPAAPATAVSSASPSAPAAADPATPAPAADAAAPATPDTGIIAPPDAPKISVDDQRKYLTEKGGKAEDLAKLSDADLQKQYDEAKAKDGQPAEIKAEDIKVTLPEGVTVDEKTMGEFQAIVADAKLSPQDRAQKLVDMHVNALKAAAEGPYKLWSETQVKWQGEVKADPEMGGKNFDQTRANIAKAITDIMGDKAQETFDAFTFTGAANHPAIVRLMTRVSKAFTEGGLVNGGALADGKAPGFAATVASMYPSATGSQARAG